MTKEELEAHPLFRLCTWKEQLWLEAYRVTDGDVLAASQRAFDRQSAASQSAMARKMLTNTRIAKLVMLIDGEDMPSAEDLVRQLWINAQTAESPGDRNDALKSIARIMGVDKAQPADPASKIAAMMRTVDENYSKTKE